MSSAALAGSVKSSPIPPSSSPPGSSPPRFVWPSPPTAGGAPPLPPPPPGALKGDDLDFGGDDLDFGGDDAETAVPGAAPPDSLGEPSTGGSGDGWVGAADAGATLDFGGDDAETAVPSLPTGSGPAPLAFDDEDAETAVPAAARPRPAQPLLFDDEDAETEVPAVTPASSRPADPRLVQTSPSELALAPVAGDRGRTPNPHAVDRQPNAPLMVEERDLAAVPGPEAAPPSPALEDSLLRAEAILDSLSDADLPDSVVLARRTPPAVVLAAESGEVPTWRRVATPALPGFWVESGAHTRPGAKGPKGGQDDSGMATGRYPGRGPAGPRPISERLRHGQALRWAAAGAVLLVIALWVGAFAGLLVQRDEAETLASFSAEAARAARRGTYGALQDADSILGAAVMRYNPRRSALRRLFGALARLLGMHSVSVQWGQARAWLALVQADLALHHGAKGSLGLGRFVLREEATETTRAAWALTRLADGDPKEALAALPRELAARSNDPIVLRVRAEALALSGQINRALASLDAVPPEQREPADRILRGQLLEGSNPEEAIEEYSAAARQSGSRRALVLRARLRRRDSGPAAEDSEALRRVLADEAGASPRDRAWAAALLAEAALRAGERTRAAELLDQAVQLGPDDDAFRLHTTRLALQQVRLDVARRQLDEALARSNGCRACRLLMAEVQLARGEPGDALAWLKSEQGDDAYTAFLMGKAHLLLGQPAEAEAHLREAIGRDAGRLDARALLGLAWVQRGLKRKGLEHLRQLLRRHPATPGVHEALGRALLKLGALGRARKAFEEALRLDPYGFESADGLCELEVRAAFGGPAQSACKRALRLNAEYLPAWRRLAALHLAEGRVEQAEKAYLQVLGLVSDDPDARRGLLHCAVALDRTAEARSMLEHQAGALGLAADYYRGLLAERAGELDQAVAHLRRALGHPELAGRALAALGRVYLALGRDDRARWVLRRAAEGDGGDPAAQLLLGDLALKGGETEEAVRHYQRTLVLLDGRLHRVDDEAAALYGLGEAYYRRGPAHHDAARRAFERAARSDPGDGTARLRLGQILERQGDRAGAMKEYQAAVAADPALAEAHWAQGRLAARRGQRDLAARALGEYLKLQPNGAHAAAARRLLHSALP